jgi:hypothetical protein
VHPAYTVHLPAVAAALEPVLGELAGLPGAPVRIDQAAASYQQQEGNGVRIDRSGEAMTGNPPTLHVILPIQGGQSMNVDELTSALRAETAPNIVSNVIGGTRRDQSVAQTVVTEAILKTSTLEPGTPAATAAQRFAALPPAVRHAWLAQHVAALRAGRITVAELP